MTDDDDAPDRETVYRRCKEWIARNTLSHADQKAAKEQQLKLSFVAHGEMSADQVNAALQALAEQKVIIHADGWLTMDPEDEDWYRQVIEWCADRENPPRGLIGACNRRLQA